MIDRVTPIPPRPSHPARPLSTALLVGLILAAGTADVVLPAVADLPGGVLEPAEPIVSPVGDYCRIRRDGLADLRLVLVADAPRPAEPVVSVRAPFLMLPPCIPPAVGTEHQSCLSRRSRAPGMRTG